ncbi:lysylphosphatidylglycerol synthase transmembrane domain-containing protein [Dyadobacter sp. CY356]|uniref:lysylphosphatidylglycerol synthase transmembrane domain-containing protein n=1 Tax=Dyadobacter sp. CY356 TaxID=2906442 RepID=UPI001F3C3412|nr:lysylphosphatidylglycerol synthase transmembrane domain-containing protein [Dyadobacter sp. CY356]MCF0054511.1 flippase-like domain-containing protein [Dyadobacter sp. CY356]
MKPLKIITILIVIVFFALFLKATDFQVVAVTIKSFGFHFLYLLLITLTAYLLATIGWKYCLGKEVKQIGIINLFVIRHLGEMFSIINPASVIGGEALKVYLLKEKGLEKTTVVASLLISRILMAATQLALFFLALILVFLLDNKRIPGLFELITLGFGIGLCIIAIAFGLRNNSVYKKLIEYPKALQLFKYLDRKLMIRPIISEFNLFFKANKRGVFLCILFFTAHWIVGSLEVFFILKFFGINATVLHVLFVDMGVVIFKAAGAFVPAQIGVEEFGNKVMLELIGVSDTGIWLTVSILRRSRQLFWILFGLVVYLFYNKKMTAIADV